jgi:sterol desaturase/sphingolipid hydroxylase (fatty acid hydroxylase superfamily)
MTFSEAVTAPMTYLLLPDKRLFFGYLLTSFFMALAVLLLAGYGPRRVFRKIFNKKVWWHKSSQVDYQLFVFNIFLRMVFLGIASVSSVAVAMMILRFLNSYFLYHGLGLSYSGGLLFFTLLSFVALDFSRFFQHYLMHKIPFLWRFHKVHHSAQVLTPMTLYRTHPVESLISVVRRTLVLGSISAIFIFLTKSPIGGYEIIGVNIFDFVFNILGSNLRHSHIWLSFGPLNYLFISPAQHQIHHSRAKKHFDKNFGIALSLWDQIFGSFHNVGKKQFLIFGLQNEKHQSLAQALRAPFR